MTEHIQRLTLRPTKTYNRVLVFFFLIFLSIELVGQDLESFNIERVSKVNTGMIVLGSWAVLNLVSSPIGSANSSGSQKYFHQMNGYWNIVNLGLAAGTIYSISKSDISSLSLAESMSELNSLQQLLLFNAGLDLAYMAGGFYLIERSKNSSNRADLFKGFGRSVILQGAFLFVFDISFYAYLSSMNSDIPNLLTNMKLTPYGLGYSLKF